MTEQGCPSSGPSAPKLVRRAGIRPGERVLDIGCGRGAVLFPAAKATGSTGHVTGIDLAQAMVALTAEDVTRAGLTHVDVRVGDATWTTGWSGCGPTAGRALLQHIPTDRLEAATPTPLTRSNPPTEPAAAWP